MPRSSLSRRSTHWSPLMCVLAVSSPLLIAAACDQAGALRQVALLGTVPGVGGGPAGAPLPPGGPPQGQHGQPPQDMDADGMAGGEIESVARDVLADLDQMAAELETANALAAPPQPGPGGGQPPPPNGQMPPPHGDAVPPPPPGEPVPQGEPPAPPACVKELRAFVRDQVIQVRERTQSAIEQIVAAFEGGDADAADAAAQAARADITALLEAAFADLNARCQACHEALLPDDAPIESFATLARGCHRAHDYLLRARWVSAHAIQDTLNRGIARGCARAARAAAADCSTASAASAEACIVNTQALIEAGDVAGAEQAARDCSAQIKSASAECVRSIHGNALECIRAIAPDCAGRPLVRRVHEQVEQAIHHVIRATHESIMQIKAALPEAPPDDSTHGAE